jgi:alkylation response protein AidB-like acyl-CoA dehydrogenase
MMTDMFARFLEAESSMARVRASLPVGFDGQLWRGLAEQGALTIRVPETAGGLGLGVFDAGLLMEEAGRNLASGPLAEALVAARLLSLLDPDDTAGLREAVASGEAVVTLAMHDVAVQAEQLVAGGAVAAAVILREGDRLLLWRRPVDAPTAAKTLASTPIARLKLDGGERTILGSGQVVLDHFAAALEEWKLLMASALTGLSRQAIRMASDYACERQQFGRPIGSYQAISHPLANLAIEVDAGRLMTWRAIRAVADRATDAGEQISLAIWWACVTAEKVVTHALHTFGGYGLTLEYDIHLYNLRAKAWPLIAGDPQRFLAEAARRRYRGEKASLPEAGEMPVEFGLGDDAEVLAAETRAAFERILTPELRAKAHYSFDGHDACVHHELGKAGLLFPNWPVEYGGRGVSAYALEAALRVWDEYEWTTHMRGTCDIIGFVMNRFASDELKADALAKIVSGEASCALGFSEPGSGSDTFAAKTRATRVGDGWRIDGQKMFTSGAEHADYLIMLARTDPDAPKHKGLTVFIVPMKAEGVTIQPVHTFQDERTNITYYDGVQIPDSWRLGEVGGGVKVMAASLEIEHGITFSREHAELIEASERLCSRIERDGKPLIESSDAQLRLTRAYANQLAAQVLHYRSLWIAAEKKENLAYGPASKMFSSEVYRVDSVDMLNLTAPEGLSFACRDAAFINQCFRHSQVTTVYGGTSEVHRSMVAERQLGLPRTR